MKKVIFAIMLVGVLLLTSCAKITVQNEEDRTELNKFNYILIKEGDEWCLHTISAYLAHEEGVGGYDKVLSKQYLGAILFDNFVQVRTGT